MSDDKPDKSLNESTPYRSGSRLPKDVEAYRKYMREYMPQWRRGLVGNCKNKVKRVEVFRPRRRHEP